MCSERRNGDIWRSEIFLDDDNDDNDDEKELDIHDKNPIFTVQFVSDFISLSLELSQKKKRNIMYP